jgi:hypothetical protein
LDPAVETSGSDSGRLGRLYIKYTHVQIVTEQKET